MKKIMIFIMIIIICFIFAACDGNVSSDIDSVISEETNYYMINGNMKEIASYYDIEDTFVFDLCNNGYNNILIYNPDELSNDILTNRTKSDSVIIERCIGIVVDNSTGNGYILNTENSEYNFISYKNIDCEINNGTIILTYLLYNPGTDYEDDIMERYDFVLDRSYED